MEAKDIVMNDEQLMKLAQVPPEDYGAPPHWWLRANRRVAKAQAEISFKAGQQEGIREVVKWFESLHACIHRTGYWSGKECGDCWRAKLREWEIDDFTG